MNKQKLHDEVKNLETIANQFIGDCTINHAKTQSKESPEIYEWFELFEEGKCTYSSPYWYDFSAEVIAMCVDKLNYAKQF